MIRDAAGYIVRNGPVTEQDRWEEDGGYSAFTLAVEISALLAAAEAMAAARRNRRSRPICAKPPMAGTSRSTIGPMRRDTEIARKLGIDGYYMRIGYSSGDANARSHDGLIPIKNRPDGNEALQAGTSDQPRCAGAGAVRPARRRRSAHSQYRARRSTRCCKRELPAGPYWYRYNDDGYGEHEDGAPFDGTGIGRLWPLLDRRTRALRTGGRPAGRGAAAAAALEASAESAAG